MKFLPGEKTVKAIGGVLLTNYRLRLEGESSGFATLRSIMLDELAFCEVTRTSNPALLFIAALALVLGVAIAAIAQSPAPAIIAFIVSLIFVALYFGSRQQVMAFASAGGRIKSFPDKNNTGASERFYRCCGRSEKHSRVLIETTKDK